MNFFFNCANLINKENISKIIDLRKQTTQHQLEFSTHKYFSEWSKVDASSLHLTISNSEMKICSALRLTFGGDKEMFADITDFSPPFFLKERWAVLGRFVTSTNCQRKGFNLYLLKKSFEMISRNQAIDIFCVTKNSSIENRLITIGFQTIDENGANHNRLFMLDKNSLEDGIENAHLLLKNFNAVTEIHCD